MDMDAALELLRDPTIAELSRKEQDAHRAWLGARGDLERAVAAKIGTAAVPLPLDRPDLHKKVTKFREGPPAPARMLVIDTLMEMDGKGTFDEIFAKTGLGEDKRPSMKQVFFQMKGNGFLTKEGNTFYLTKDQNKLAPSLTEAVERFIMQATKRVTSADIAAHFEVEPERIYDIVHRLSSTKKIEGDRTKGYKRYKGA